MVRKLATSTVVLALLIALHGAAAQAATPPPSFNDTFLGTTAHVYPNCNADGSGTVYWSASGTAVGTYSGSFYEVGAAKYGPVSSTITYLGQPFFSQIIDIRATFYVNSLTFPAQVVGTKQLITGGRTVGRCAYADAVWIQAIDTSVISYGEYERQLSWQAYIHPAGDGTYSDSGTASIFITRHDQLGQPGTVLSQTFWEDFSSTQPAPTPWLGGDQSGPAVPSADLGER